MPLQILCLKRPISHFTPSLRAFDTPASTAHVSISEKEPARLQTQYGLGFDPQDDETVVDFFCGGGGAGTGLEMGLGLGRPVTIAKNHSPATIRRAPGCDQPVPG